MPGAGAIAPRRQIGNVPRSAWCAGVVGAALILALASSPASARSRYRLAHKEHKEAGHASKEPFGDIPKGPVQIFVSIDQQKLHLYSDGVHVADTSIATGVLSLPTPLGVFSVIQKQVFHRSNIYSNAPMPFMQRITWSGVALHEGESIGHRASHGCIRMPGDFARRLYSVTKLGARVIVADPELKPADFADPHLFVHKDMPVDQADAVALPADSIKTAQSVDAGKTVDAPADATAKSKPAELGLRVSHDSAAASDAVKTDSPAADPPQPDAAKSDPPKAEASAVASAGPDAEGAPAGEIEDAVPMPLLKPAALAKDAPAKNTPIAIFVSRKEKKIYVRQNFEPLFDAAITIAHPEQPLGTHVFTAMEYLDDQHTTFRWNVVSLPGAPPPARATRLSEREDRFGKHSRHRYRDEDAEKPARETAPPQTPQQALARIDIPQDVIDHIAELMVPGSSLVVSDQGLGDETGDGTDFIVVMR